MSIEQAVWQDSERVSGALCFRNTRIPVSILFDYLRVEQLEEFFEDFPDVTRAQVNAVLTCSEELLYVQFKASA